MHHVGPGGARTGPEIWGSWENDFLVGFGGKWPCPKASWVPYNPIPSHKSPPNPMGNHFLHEIMFSGAPFFRKKVPGPAGIQIWDPGSQKWSLGVKIPKFRVEKPCRIQWSVFQTEPYVATYGRKPFRAGCPPTEANVSADKTSVVSCLQTRYLLCQQTGHLLCHCVSSHLIRHPPQHFHHRSGREAQQMSCLQTHWLRVGGHPARNGFRP